MEGRYYAARKGRMCVTDTDSWEFVFSSILGLRVVQADNGDLGDGVDIVCCDHREKEDLCLSLAARFISFGAAEKEVLGGRRLVDCTNPRKWILKFVGSMRTAEVRWC